MADYDVCIIGGGPGGYVAAIRAAQLGLSTCLVEAAELGGVCLNWGCIPTKALLRSAELMDALHHLPEYGLAADNPRADLAAVVARSRAVAGQLSSGVAFLMKKNKVTVIAGRARLAGDGKVIVETNPSAGGASGTKAGSQTVTAKHIVIATGARAKLLPGIVPGGPIWTAREAMLPDAIPETLLVVGAGAIGIEFASFYAAMGTKVTVVEAAARILPAEDEEIAGIAAKAFEKRGITLLTGAKLGRLTPEGDTVRAQIEGRSEMRFSRALLAIGITGNIEEIGLEAAGVATERGFIITDGLGRTAAPVVYAIGDVAGPPWLAHKASHEGTICIEAIAGLSPHPLNKSAVPGCTYSAPQIASIGLTEAAAKAAGRAVKIGRFPFSANGKALALGEPGGLVKVLFDDTTGALLGAHLVGPEVTELIQGYAIAMACEATEAELMATIFPHPTLSEAMHEATLAAYGRALHI